MGQGEWTRHIRTKKSVLLKRKSSSTEMKYQYYCVGKASVTDFSNKEIRIDESLRSSRYLQGSRWLERIR